MTEDTVQGLVDELMRQGDALTEEAAARSRRSPAASDADTAGALRAAAKAYRSAALLMRAELNREPPPWWTAKQGAGG